tara:strand:+ start:197 stop:406 length:210 start_codon:yes stop_codon:yes gene_type:complete
MDFNIFKDNHLYKISEIAKQTGAHKLTVYRQLKNKKIPYTKLNPEGRTQLYRGKHLNKIFTVNGYNYAN